VAKYHNFNEAHLLIPYYSLPHSFNLPVDSYYSRRQTDRQTDNDFH
jgi:hypothetical protein